MLLEEKLVGNAASPKVLSVLLGKKYVPLAVRSMANWSAMSQVDFRLRVFNDGSLEECDQAALQSALGKIEFVSKAEAEDVTAASLRSRYPNCWKYRNKHFWGTKLFDIPLNSKKTLHYLDADILFSQKCDFGDFWRLENYPFIFMQDATNAYSFDWKGLLELNLRHWPKQIPAIERANAGVLAIDLKYFDLDYLEFLFSSPTYGKILNGFFEFYEQTTLSLLGAKYGAGLMSPQDVILANGEVYGASDFPNFLGVHFAGPCRHMMESAFHHLAQAKSKMEPVIIRTIPASKYSIAGIYKNSLRKKLNIVGRCMAIPGFETR